MAELLKYDFGYTKSNVQKSLNCLRKAEVYLLQLVEDNKDRDIDDKEIEKMYVTLHKIKKDLSQWLEDYKLS